MFSNGALITAMKNGNVEAPSLSAIENLAPNHPPTCVVNASGDLSLRPPLHSEQLYRRLQAMGVESAMCVAEGAPHAFAELKVSMPGTMYWTNAILPALDWAVAHV
jgi:acetyl esterase/lipase